SQRGRRQAARRARADRRARERTRRRSEPASEHLHAEGHGVAAPETQGGEAGRLLPVLQGEQEGREDPGAGRADRVPEGDRASVHGHAVPVPAEGTPVGDRLDGERLVGFDEIVVADFHHGFRHEILHRDDGREEQIPRLAAALKRHASIAATAFWWLASAKRSWSARDTPAFLAVYLARLPMWVFENESHSPSSIMPSTSWLLPALMPPRIP